MRPLFGFTFKTQCEAQRLRGSSPRRHVGARTDYIADPTLLEGITQSLLGKVISGLCSIKT